MKTAAAKYAPIMYSEPCARFTKFMIPNTSVSPAGEQEQQDAELQAVEHLGEEEADGHGWSHCGKRPASATPALAPLRRGRRADYFNVHCAW